MEISNKSCTFAAERKSMEESQYINNDFLAPRDAWDALSLPEKAAMMNVAVKNGIYDLSAIRQKYNEFAEGGKKENEEYYSTMEKVAEENYKDWGTNSPEEALVQALNDNTYNYKEYYRNNPSSTANAITHWPDTYKTVYHPTFSVESIYSGRPSQYNPQGLYGGHWIGDKFIPAPWQIENRHSIGGPIVEDANEFATGGHKIHIKPSHRGRLTELKKRTGKTEAELYRTGGPAVRKMITFARNARKWKHEEGGPLFIGLRDNLD